MTSNTACTLVPYISLLKHIKFAPKIYVSLSITDVILTSSKMPLSAEGRISFAIRKTAQWLRTFRNRNLIDWRNWNKSLFVENL